MLVNPFDDPARFLVNISPVRGGTIIFSANPMLKKDIPADVNF